MSSSRNTSHFHVLLPGPGGATVLAIDAGDGYALPGWSTAEDFFWQETASINSGIYDLLGVSVATVRACRLDWSSSERHSYYVVESLDRGWQAPSSASWIDVEAAERLRWLDPREQAVLRAFFAERPTPRRVPWYRPGWFDAARRWIEMGISEAGLVRTGPVVQLRSWERSSIMSVDTDGGRLFFKAVARQWGHEPALTRYLSERFPDRLPSLISADPDCGRMLLREFPGSSLQEIRNPDIWMSAYAALGRLQRGLVGSTEQLQSLGVPLRDLDAISCEIPEMLVDRRRMRVGMDGGLTDGQAARLQAAAPAILSACRRLADGPVPLSLDHGDFWPGNIYAGPDRITLFDWSDATITHPFFSLVMAANEIADGLPEIPAAAEQVIDAYLAEWMDFGSMDELRAVFEDAMLVAPLHLSIMYRSVYLPAMEFVDELDRMTAHFLRWLAGKL